MRSKTVTIIAVVLVAAVLVLPTTSHAWRGGWYGPGFFAGGVLLGAALASPYYYPPPAYYYPPPAYTYPPPAYAYPPPAQAYPPPAQAYGAPPAQAYGAPPGPEAPPSAQGQSKGQWVEVPGQTINNLWVPPHKVWVPDN